MFMVLSLSIPWPTRFGIFFGGGGVVLVMVVVLLSTFDDAVNQAVILTSARLTGCPCMPVADIPTCHREMRPDTIGASVFCITCQDGSFDCLAAYWAFVFKGWLLAFVVAV